MLLLLLLMMMLLLLLDSFVFVHLVCLLHCSTLCPTPCAGAGKGQRETVQDAAGGVLCSSQDGNERGGGALPQAKRRFC